MASLSTRGAGRMATFGTTTAAAFSPPRFSGSITASEIERITVDIQDKFSNAVDKIESSSRGGGGGVHGGGTVSDGEWDATFGALSLALGEASASSARVTLPSMTHGDAAAREASTAAKDDLKKMFDDAFARRGLFDALSSSAPASALASSSEASSHGSPSSSWGGRSDADARLASSLLDRFRRNGCGIEDESVRRALAQKREDIERTCSAFCGAINENKEFLTFTDAELDGIPDLGTFEVLDGSGSGRRKVSLKAPDTAPVLQFAKNPETRKAVAVAVARKCQEENTERFLDVLKMRHDCAEILGYPSHSHYMLETAMASTPERVESFLTDLVERFKEMSKTDLGVLQSLKDAEEGPHAGPLNTWDAQYYIRAHKATLGVDEAELQKYFPLDHVKGEILSIYEELLGLTFTRQADAEVWHPDVECYAVGNATAVAADDDGSSGDDGPLGFFYLDLFPREGKYSHQCVYPLRPSYVSGPGGDRVRPACVNIGNLSRGSNGKPSMLRFREVETFFHEFGHVMHCVLTKSEHSLQSWAWSAVPWPGGVEQDFLEVPSMMLENFVWRPEILRRLSRRPGEEEDGDGNGDGGSFSSSSSLPEEMIAALSESRFVMEGYHRSRYLAMALYDLKVHSSEGPYEYNGQQLDAEALYGEMMLDIGGVPTIPESFAVCSWYHPLMGYDAGYYSYIWSEAFAADMFATFEASSSGIVDAALGTRYRDSILSPCAMQDGNTMLRNFLGRDPSSDAFLQRLGIA